MVAQYGFYYSDIVGLDDFKSGKAKTIAGITTPDDSTIVFKTTKPVGDLPYRLAMPATARSARGGQLLQKAGSTVDT